MEKKSFNYKLNSSKTITINNKKNANNLTKSIIIKKWIKQGLNDFLLYSFLLLIILLFYLFYYILF